MFKHIQWLFLNRSDIVVCVLIAVFSDIDECGSSTSPCEGGKSCKNTMGSYECSCKQGFQWDGKACSGKHGVEHCSVGDWQLFVSKKQILSVYPLKIQELLIRIQKVTI